jgi:hypothetical protein
MEVHSGVSLNKVHRFPASAQFSPNNGRADTLLRWDHHEMLRIEVV